MSTKKKKKKTQKEIQMKVDSKRLTKILSKMRKGGSRLPPNHSRRCYDFSASEVGIDSNKDTISRNKIVKNYEYDPDLNKQENKELSATYYAEIRKALLEEVREALQTPLVLPEAHDPEGSTTLDLSNLTSAGVENAE